MNPDAIDILLILSGVNVLALVCALVGSHVVARVALPGRKKAPAGPRFPKILQEASREAEEETPVIPPEAEEPATIGERRLAQDLARWRRTRGLDVAGRQEAKP